MKNVRSITLNTWTHLQVFKSVHLFIGHGAKQITFNLKYYNMVSSTAKTQGSTVLARNHLFLHPLLSLLSLADHLIQVW